MKTVQPTHRLNHQGMTLVEVLLVMGLMSVLLMILATIFTAIVDIQAQNQSYSAVSSEGRFVMSRLNYDIARATSISTPTALGASSASLAMVVGGSTYTYSLNTGRLQLVDNIGTDFLTSNTVTVSALSFQRLGDTGEKESIRYSVTITSVARGRDGQEAQTFTATVERR